MQPHPAIRSEEIRAREQTLRQAGGGSRRRPPHQPRPAVTRLAARVLQSTSDSLARGAARLSA